MYESYINKIEDIGKLRNLKPSTIRTYQNNVRDFLKFINKHPDELTCLDARDFLLHLKNKGDKASTLNNKNGALVFFYKRVLGKLWDDNLVPRAINDYAIPRVLTRDEIEKLLDATLNLKYKAIFAIMYSSGLRVSEVLHLHYDDISRTNMQIYIHSAKNHTSRYALLSQRALDILTEYWFKCGKPRDILFPNQWKDKGEKFFLPVKVLSKLFRGKYMDELKTLWEDNKLEFHGTSEKYRNHFTFKELLDTCYNKEWIPHCKKTFNGAQSVINYLGKYTHRIAISNHRIICMDETTVTYYAKDYREEGNWKELTISGIEFIRRFLMHVPPKRFVRIRHYGLLCTRSKNKHLTLCRNLLGCKQYLSRLKDMETPQILETLYGIKITVCKCCGGHLGKPQK